MKRILTLILTGLLVLGSLISADEFDGPPMMGEFDDDYFDGTNLQELKQKYENFTLEDMKKEQEELKNMIDEFKSSSKDSKRPRHGMVGDLKGFMRKYRDLNLIKELEIKDEKSQLKIYKLLKEKQISNIEHKIQMGKMKSDIKAAVNLGNSSSDIDKLIEKSLELKKEAFETNYNIDKKILAELSTKQKVKFLSYPEELRKKLRKHADKFRNRQPGHERMMKHH